MKKKMDATYKFIIIILNVTPHHRTWVISINALEAMHMPI
jgi:hypothetical protein